MCHLVRQSYIVVRTYFVMDVAICVPTWDTIFELEVLPMKKLLFIIPSVLLLLAAGTLVFCKHHAERSGLACMDIDL